MYTCTQICTVVYTCIHIHKSLKKKKHSTAFETKTASPNSCFLFPFLCLTSNPLAQHLYPLVSPASDSPCIGPLSQCATALHAPLTPPPIPPPPSRCLPDAHLLNECPQLSLEIFSTNSSNSPGVQGPTSLALVYIGIS